MEQLRALGTGRATDDPAWLEVRRSRPSIVARIPGLRARPSRLRALAVALGFCAMHPHAGNAAQFFYSPELETIFVDGTIADGDFVRLKRASDEAAGKVKRIYLSSPGGNFMTALDIGYWIREHGYDTVASVMCDSACAYIWLAGNHLYTNSLVHLHMPFYRTSQVTIAIPDEGLVAATWYLAQMGCSKALVDALLVISTTEMNQAFPITGPNTYLYHIRYDAMDAEKPYRDALTKFKEPKPTPVPLESD